jgi:DNA-binding transcriptional MerR regulator/ABC-type Fe3+-hydroxamate transport system substrate-binding protein
MRKSSRDSGIPSSTLAVDSHCSTPGSRKDLGNMPRSLDLVTTPSSSLAAALKTIGEVAELAGVSSETLRWYDRIGLLKPQARTEAGYRLYGRQELVRLREILIWRHLGFPIADIAALIDDPGHDLAEAVCRQLELATEQLEKFQAITQGLEIAASAIDAGRSPTEDDVFRGFARSLAVDHSIGQNEERPRGSASKLAPFGVVGGRGSDRQRRLASPNLAPVRVAGTDPIRLAENLLALGILPVGAGSFRDALSGEHVWPWPDSVEAPLRQRIVDLGYYGTDRAKLAEAQPELIIDLRFPETGRTLLEVFSEGRFTRTELSAMAPTLLLDAPLEPAGFITRLEQIAEALALQERVKPLRTAWAARTAALRAHVAGTSVSAFLLWDSALLDGKRSEGIGLTPTERHEAQIFTALGLEMSPAPDGALTHWGGSVVVTRASLRMLDAQMLFLACSFEPHDSFDQVLATGKLNFLPMVKNGRVHELKWRHMRQGWFTAHAQLDAIARAFEVCRLRADLETGAIYTTVASNGRIAFVAPPELSGPVRLRGPRLSVPLDLNPGVPTSITVDADLARDISLYPDGYHVEVSKRAQHSLKHDRESALCRLAQHQIAQRRPERHRESGRNRSGAKQGRVTAGSAPRSLVDHSSALL